MSGTSYPYMRIAEDYRLPYATVLSYADGVQCGYDPEQFCDQHFSIWELRAQVEVNDKLDRAARARFHAAVRRQVEVMRAAHAGR